MSPASESTVAGLASEKKDDSLPAPVFNGDVQPYARPGHIPGAINVPATSMVDAETGRFRPVEEIRAKLPDRPEARTVAY